MSIIDCDYLPDPPPQPVPPELAILIVRKAASMAERFESECLETMTRTARRQLSDGSTPAEIARQLEL